MRVWNAPEPRGRGPRRTEKASILSCLSTNPLLLRARSRQAPPLSRTMFPIISLPLSIKRSRLRKPRARQRLASSVLCLVGHTRV